MTAPVLDLSILFARRALDQRCPRCGHREAAGAYCSRCLAPTSLPDYRAARPLLLRTLRLPKGAPIAA